MYVCSATRPNWGVVISAARVVVVIPPLRWRCSSLTLDRILIHARTVRRCSSSFASDSSKQQLRSFKCSSAHRRRSWARCSEVRNSRSGARLDGDQVQASRMCAREQSADLWFDVAPETLLYPDYQAQMCCIGGCLLKNKIITSCAARVKKMRICNPCHTPGASRCASRRFHRLGCWLRFHLTDVYPCKIV